jgi:hypothetical protein
MKKEDLFYRIEVATQTIQREIFPMNHFTTVLFEALVIKQDATEVFRSHLETAMNHFLGGCLLTS